MYFDPSYFIFVIPPLLLGLWAQMKVKGAYAKWTQVRNQRGLTGLDAANMIIPPEGLQVSIEGIPGQLTDHYDPRSKKLRLSQGVAQQPSVAALAIVAHELGHALQDSQGYAPLKLRGAIVPAVKVSSMGGAYPFLRGSAVQLPAARLARCDFLRRRRRVRADHPARRVQCQPPGSGSASNLSIGRRRGVEGAPRLCWMRPRSPTSLLSSSPWRQCSTISRS